MSLLGRPFSALDRQKLMSVRFARVGAALAGRTLGEFFTDQIVRPWRRMRACGRGCICARYCSRVSKKKNGNIGEGHVCAGKEMCPEWARESFNDAMELATCGSGRCPAHRALQVRRLCSSQRAGLCLCSGCVAEAAPGAARGRPGSAEAATAPAPSGPGGGGGWGSW